jgi:hypothetical protein
LLIFSQLALMGYTLAVCGLYKVRRFDLIRAGVRTAALCCGFSLPVLCGCSSNHPPAEKGSAAQFEPIDRIEPEQVQARIMGFADRYVTSMADVYEQAALSAPTAEGRIMAQRAKLYAAQGAMGNAVDPNPIAGMIDMALMVTIRTDLSAQPWNREMFGLESADAISAMHREYEAEIWPIVADYLTPAQIAELQDLAKKWIVEHPGQHLVTSARLADFAPPKGENNNENGGGVTNVSVFSVVRIDPFEGLQPAVQQFKQSRLLAERAFFYFQHTPLLVSWQSDLLFSHLLDSPQIKHLLDESNVVTGATTRVTDAAGHFSDAAGHFSDATSHFSDATSRFSDHTGQIANSVERFRQQLPVQQSQFMAQIDQIITNRQDRLASNMQDVINSSIDRSYLRLRSLVLVIAGAFVGAWVLYRTINAIFFKTRPSR